MAGSFQSVWMDLLLVSITMMMLQPQEVSTGGENFKNEVMEKCKTKFIEKRCQNFWDKFSKAFIGKDPGTVKPEAYSELINAEPIVVEKDKLLLWSKTSDEITWLSQQENPHFFLIGNTIFSILDKKTWCGAKNKNDVLTEGCPGYATDVNPVKSYWKIASAALAKAATGTVTVLLNGSIEIPYDSRSIFATDELPNLDKKVTLHVLLLQNQKQGQPCNNNSIKQLKKSWKGTNYECRYAEWSSLQKKSPKDWWNTATSGLSRRNSIR